MKDEFEIVNWGYEVRTSIPWMISFAERLGSQDVRIYREVEDGQYDYHIWSSIHLNEFTDEKRLYERASALNAIFDGAMYSYKGADYEPLWEGRVESLKNGRAITNQERNPMAEPFWKDYVDLTPEKPDHFVARVIHKSRYDLSIRQILLFLGVNGLSWNSLYAVLDTMNSAQWGRDVILAKGIATKAELEAFNHTANNPAAIGPFARHGD